MANAAYRPAARRSQYPVPARSSSTRRVRSIPTPCSSIWRTPVRRPPDRQPRQHRQGTKRGRFRRHHPRGAHQRLDHRVDLPRRRRRRERRRGEPRLPDAAEDTIGGAGAGTGHAGHPDPEKAEGLEVGRIGFEIQIENARGLLAVNEIAAASPRNETLIFGPADFMASIQMKSLVVGEQPDGYDTGDAYHHPDVLLMAARANDLQVIDGPYLAIKDLDGLRRVAGRSAALGFDGKWALHPTQIDIVNDIFSPAGRLRPRREHPRRLRLVHLRRRRARRGDAGRRDDRRGLLQDGTGRPAKGRAAGCRGPMCDSAAVAC